MDLAGGTSPVLPGQDERVSRLLQPHHLRVGERLPWPLYAPSGVLLLSEGALIRGEEQIESLLTARACYFLDNNPGRNATATLRDDGAAPVVSPFVIAHTLIERLDAVFALRRDVAAGDSFVRAILRLALDIQSCCDENSDAILGTMQLIIDAPHGLAHPLHAALLCEVVCRRTGQGPLERLPIVAAALTHDIGMYSIQQQLFDQAGPMTDAQRQAVAEHPQQSHDMLQALGVRDKRWLLAVLQHHERLDGKGYPRGISGDQVVRDARLLGITDCYSAMIRPRAYRDQVLSRDALREIFQLRGNSIDAALARQFINVMGVFAPGSLVRLRQGEIALVTGRAKALDQPNLALLTDTRGTPLVAPHPLEQADHTMIAQLLRAQEHHWLISLAGHVWPFMRPLPPM